MFNKLTDKVYKTIKYTVLLLVLLSFISIISYSITVMYSDYNSKSSQLAQQYAKCIEVQINSCTKAAMLIKDNLNEAIYQNNTIQLDTLERTVRMAHNAIYDFKLYINDDNLKNSPVYKLSENSTIRYTIQYDLPDNKNVYGVLIINLPVIIDSFKLKSNIFMKDSDIYISQDDITYYPIEINRIHRNITSQSYTKKELENKLTSTAKKVEILDGELIIYTVPRFALLSTIMPYVVACFFIFILLFTFACGIIRKYTVNFDNQLNILVKDMDEYIQNKEEVNNDDDS